MKCINCKKVNQSNVYYILGNKTENEMCFCERCYNNNILPYLKNRITISQIKKSSGAFRYKDNVVQQK